MGFLTKKKPSPLLQMTAEAIKPVYMLQPTKVNVAWLLNHYLVMYYMQEVFYNNYLREVFSS